MNSMMLAALGGQLLSATLSLEEAQVFVKDTLRLFITDEEISKKEIFKKASRTLFKLKQSASLDREKCCLLFDELIKDHSSCKLLPLPRIIDSARYGNASVLASQRVFYLQHDDQQDDSWSCGYRSILSAAWLQSHLKPGSVMSSTDLGSMCRDLRLRNPGIRGCIEYIAFRTKIEEVRSLIREDQNNVEEALALLSEQEPDTLKVLLQLQPDYFIRRVVLKFLKANLKDGRIVDSIALMGKASHNAIKAAGTQLVKLVMRKITVSKVDALLKAIQDALKREKDSELKRIVSGTHLEARVEMVELMLTSRPLSLKNQIAALCERDSAVKERYKQLRQELERVKSLNFSEFSAEIEACRNKVKAVIEANTQEIQDVLCANDPRLREINQVIDRCGDPKIRAALALFHSADFAHDEVIDLLKSSEINGIQGALQLIDESQCTLIQKYIADVTERLAKNEPEGPASIGGSSSDSAVERVLGLLQMAVDLLNEKRVDAEKNIREARNVWREAVNERFLNAFSRLGFGCPKAGVLTVPTEQLRGYVEKLRDPLIDRAKRALDNLQPGDDMRNAVAAIRAIRDITTKEDAIALLQSDHTKGNAWTVSPVYKLACQRLVDIKSALPEYEDEAYVDHLIKLARMPMLGLPQDHVHMLGDFANRGDVANRGQLLFDFLDPFLSRILDSLVDACETQDQKSDRAVDAIREHFKVKYLDTNTAGAHHFICRINGNHWILVSLVKFADRKPILVVLDSFNKQIESNSGSGSVGADTVLAFLYNKLLVPLG